MKVRTGFVSNSSSTAFMFVYKNESIEELCQLIEKYDQYFNLYSELEENESYKCTARQVASAIEEELSDNNEDIFCKTKKMSLDKYIKDIQDMLDKNVEQIKEYQKEGKQYKDYNWLTDYIYQNSQDLYKLQNLKKQGFTQIVIANFGDNDGPWRGTDLGRIMDYEGRYIYINKPDFVVWTEQNR